MSGTPPVVMPAHVIPAGAGQAVCRAEPDRGRAPRLRGEIRGLPLSRREADVLVARVNTGTDLDAARALGVSLVAVKAYLRDIREKLGASTTPHAAALAFRRLGHRYEPGR